MAAAGKKTVYDATFLTPKVLYRTVTADDTGPSQSSPAITDIRLDLDSNKLVQNSPNAASYMPADRGYNGRLAVYVHASSGANPILKLYAWGGDDAIAGPQAWVLVATSAAAGSNISHLVKYQDLPANRYRIVVTGISGGSVSLVEQHTE